MRVLMITCEWPTEAEPQRAMFVKRQADALRALGVEVDVHPFRGGGSPMRYLRHRAGVARRLRAARYDLVHAQWGQSALLALPKRLPLVVTFRGSDLAGFPGPSGRYSLQGRVLARASRMVARIADEIILVSASLARYLPARPYSIIPSGLDLERFRPMPREEARRALGLDTQAFLALFAADPKEPIKRVALARAAVRQAAAELAATPESAPAGPGLTRIDLIVASGIPFERMPLYMNACDALLVTSSHEGSPNVVKEALACDLPVVSTDVGDVRQRLTGIAGCHVCGGATAEQLAASLAAALAAVARRGGRINGRASVLQLDEQAMAQQVVDVYRRAQACT